MVSSQNPLDLENWYVWKEDWPDWRPVLEVEGVKEVIDRIMHVLPPPPPATVKESVVSQSQDLLGIFESNRFRQQEGSREFLLDKEYIARSKRRFPKRMVVTITSNQGQVFKTHTQDISVGGMSFEDSLPEWVAGYFKVRIAKPNSKQQIELSCCLIENQNVGERFRVAILPLENMVDEKNLEAWLAA